MVCVKPWFTAFLCQRDLLCLSSKLIQTTDVCLCFWLSNPATIYEELRNIQQYHANESKCSAPLENGKRMLLGTVTIMSIWFDLDLYLWHILSKKWVNTGHGYLLLFIEVSSPYYVWRLWLNSIRWSLKVCQYGRCCTSRSMRTERLRLSANRWDQTLPLLKLKLFLQRSVLIFHKV